MLLKKLTQNYKDSLPVIFLGIFSFLINFHYGFIGIMPLDNTVLYNGGYRVLNGYVPFTDYWLVTGPLLDYLNAFFFYILGISWKTFIIHSSFFNLFFSLSSYYLFLKLGQSIKYSFFYSILISILFYPIVGTPFVDHHSTFFMILAFYSLIMGINNKNYLFFSIIPFLFCLSFLSKQTPAAYGMIALGLLLLFYIFSEKKNIRKKILFPLVLGSIFSIIFLLLFFLFTGIKSANFIDQYILFSKTIGGNRFSNYDFSVLNIINKYKFINFFIFILLYVFYDLIIRRKKIQHSLIVLASIFLAIILIFHQYYTLNQNYIFFIIPYLCCIFHLYSGNFKLKKYMLVCTIGLCIFSVSKYHLRFNEQRKFNELEKVNINKAVNAEILSKDLKGLMWITYLYPNNPMKEINQLKKVMNIIKKDKSKKTLITDYQFIAPSLKIYDFSPNQWHHPTVSFPIKGQIYYNEYKNFFIKSLVKNDINYIFETTETNKSKTELILDKSCLEKERLSSMLIKFKLLKNCKDFQ